MAIVDPELEAEIIRGRVEERPVSFCAALPRWKHGEPPRQELEPMREDGIRGHPRNIARAWEGARRRPRLRALPPEVLDDYLTTRWGALRETLVASAKRMELRVLEHSQIAPRERWGEDRTIWVEWEDDIACLLRLRGRPEAVAHLLSSEAIERAFLPDTRGIGVSETDVRSAPDLETIDGVSEDALSSWGIERIGADAVIGSTSPWVKSVRVGMLDGAVDFRHPDLQSLSGYSWGKHADGPPSIHSTHCAGIIAGRPGGGQRYGVCPEAELYVAAVCDPSGSTTWDGVVSGVRWLIEQEVLVINASIGGQYAAGNSGYAWFLEFLEERASQLGVAVVTSVGNEGHGHVSTPGVEDHVYTIGASAPSDRVSGTSGGRTLTLRGAGGKLFCVTKPDLVAPGVAIRSCIPGAKWGYLDGSSMASAFAVGALALLLSRTNLLASESDPVLRVEMMKALLESGCEPLGEFGKDQRYGWGRLDLRGAFQEARRQGYRVNAPRP